MTNKLISWIIGGVVLVAVALPVTYIGVTEIAARKGIPPAQSELGRWYEDGVWLRSIDKEKAFAWYLKAAENNYAKGQYNLGLLLKRQGDYKGAAHWYLLAANQDFASAQNNLAVLYSEGLGVTKNQRTAVFWYEKAAQNGNEIAQYSLGLAYMNGRGVDVDYKKSVYWIQQSEKQDFATAQGHLALLYATGDGVEKDYTEALLWAKKAYANGNKQSADTITLIEKLQH